MKKCCKNCSAWRQDLGLVESHGERQQWGVCGFARSVAGQPVVAVPWAWAVDWEGHTADLQTFEDFGCVLFEARPA
jgi:hypothetical protein